MKNSFRLFRLAGIDVSIHYAWFIIVLFEVDSRKGAYASLGWNVAEVLTLFGIVLLHEFGHAFATRQTGGKAENILLWPFGGIAFVQAPERPGAQLWAIAAGPLVNVALIPVTFLICHARGIPFSGEISDRGLDQYLSTVAWINLSLLKFNLLPIYPLDGGQILRSLLWYPFGRMKSLRIACVLGFVGGGGLIAYGLLRHDLWLVFIVAYLLQQSWQTFKYVRELDGMARHENFACPQCGEHPIQGDYWGCKECDAAYDPFTTNATCPKCGAIQETTICPFCRRGSNIKDWSQTKNP